MADPRWERLGAATGIVFVVLSVLALFIGGQPGAAPDVVQYFIDNRGRLLVQSFLAGLASIFFLWFLGSVWSYLRAAEGGTGRLSAVAFAGGILTMGLLMFSLVVSYALADRMAELSPRIRAGHFTPWSWRLPTWSSSRSSRSREPQRWSSSGPRPFRAGWDGSVS